MKPTVLPESFLRRMSPKDRKPMGKSGRTWDEIQQTNTVKDERTLQKRIAAFLTLRDVWFHQSRMDRPHTGKVGTPDFIFMWNGRAYALEAKIGKAEPTEAQINCHCQMRRNGWLVFVVRSVQEAREFLDGKEQRL